MKKLVFIIISVSVFFIFSCNNKSENEKTNESKNPLVDSISKAQQKIIVDSLKKKNPLLILPPDSNYTGEYIDKYNNGIIKFKGYFRFGKRHGQWLSFYPNGLAWSELHYDKGFRNGLNVTYFGNGKIRYSGFYKNDVRDSIWLYYDSIGNVSEKVLFKNDRMIKKLQAK
jgi:hypothetical protein